MIESLKALDLSFFLFLNSFHSETLNGPMVLLSGQAIWIPAVLYIIWFTKKSLGTKLTLIFILFLALALMASDVTSSYIIKNIFNRLRPCRNEEIKALIYHFGQRCGGKFGFVSSHAANSFTILAFAFGSLHFKKRYHLLWAFPLVVSYSRVYLGVHYPGDIVGGIIVGLFWGLLFSFFFSNLRVLDDNDSKYFL